jgi:hypothetical protein
MVIALRLGLRSSRWQAAQLDLSTQGINDPQDVLKAQGWLAGLKVNDESHANPCR